MSSVLPPKVPGAVYGLEAQGVRHRQKGVRLHPGIPGGAPRPFLCRLTAHGFQIWEEAPGQGPVDGGPIFVRSQGLGNAPVVFAGWSEIEAALSDLVLTLPELPSAIIGSANRFVATYVNGPPPEDRLMNKVSAGGKLPDGRELRISGKESEGRTHYMVTVW